MNKNKSKKPSKGVCKKEKADKACACGKETACRPVCVEGMKIFEKAKDLLQKRVDTCTSMAVKAADVLKFFLVELDNLEKSAEGLLDELDKYESCSSKAVNTDNVKDAVKYIDSLVEDELPRTAKAVAKKDETDSDLIRLLFSESKYAIAPGEMTAIYRRDLKPRKEGGMPYEFIVQVERQTSDGSATVSTSESFICELTSNKEESVKEFDECVGRMMSVRFLTKEEEKKLRCERKEAVDTFNDVRPKAEKIVKKHKGLTKAAMQEIGKLCSKTACKEEPFPTCASFLKKLFVEKSAYKVSPYRFKIEPTGFDKKHQQYTYCLSFFSKSYKHCKDATNAVEKFTFRVNENDTDEKVVARFDKKVSVLKASKFEKRA